MMAVRYKEKNVPENSLMANAFDLSISDVSMNMKLIPVVTRLIHKSVCASIIFDDLKRYLLYKYRDFD